MKICNYKYHFLPYIWLSIVLGTINFTYAIENTSSTDILYKPQNDGAYSQALYAKNVNSVITNSTISPIAAEIQTTQNNILPIRQNAPLKQDALAKEIYALEHNDVYTIGVGVGLSSLGGQISITGPLNDDRSLVWRLIYNDLELYGIQEGLEEDGTFDITTEFTDPQSTIAAHLALEMNSTGLFFDWHPWVDGFALSLGIVKNDFIINIAINNIAIKVKKEITLVSILGNFNTTIQASSNLDINYTDTYAPYIGMRFSNALASGWPISCYLDIGAIHAGSLAYSKVQLKINNENEIFDDIIKSSPMITTLIEDQKEEARKEMQTQIDSVSQEIDDELADLKDLLTWFPVISIGVQVSF